MILEEDGKHLFDFRFVGLRLELYRNWLVNCMGGMGQRGNVYFEHYDVDDGHDCWVWWKAVGARDEGVGCEVIIRYYSQDQTYTGRKEWPVTLGENYSSGRI